jgi:tetratricopeptide (TPR) repeat protein
MKRVSSMSLGLIVLILMLPLPVHAQGEAGPKTANPQEIFEAGEAALRAGKLDEAERDFRQVLAVDAGVAGAYANLGVIHMRRKQWPQALAMLHKAEKLAPKVAGIRFEHRAGLFPAGRLSLCDQALPVGGATST